MPYEDPLEAALRALTDVVWVKKKEHFEARINKTHFVGIQQALADHHIGVTGDVSENRSGRYIARIAMENTPKILKAMEKTGAEVKPHRRKRNNH